MLRRKNQVPQDTEIEPPPFNPMAFNYSPDQERDEAGRFADGGDRAVAGKK